MITITYPEDESVKKEILSFCNQPYIFDDFLDFPDLTDQEIKLILKKKVPADPTRNWVPAYHFAIIYESKEVGSIDLRIGYSESLYYGGNIGYAVDQEYRGRGFAPRACQLIAKVAKAHGMKKLNISNEYRNVSSRRVCEKIGAKFSRTVKLPDWNDMRDDGHEYENIFVWDIENL